MTAKQVSTKLKKLIEEWQKKAEIARGTEPYVEAVYEENAMELEEIVRQIK